MGNPELIGSSEKFQAVVDDLTKALDGEYKQLQLLVGELLLKNHQLRCEVARLRDATFSEALAATAA